MLPVILAPALAGEAVLPDASRSLLPAPASDSGAAAAGEVSVVSDGDSARRTQLTFHQAMGLTTLGAMAVTGAMGTALWLTRMSGAGKSVTSPLETLHEWAAFSTGVSYLTAAALAVSAPPKPYESAYEGADSVLVHRGLALLHLTGMASTFTLGLISLDQGPASPWVPYHQILGLTTFGLLTASAAVIAIDF